LFSTNLQRSSEIYDGISHGEDVQPAGPQIYELAAHRAILVIEDGGDSTVC
jgi:hypothetical protein